MKLVNYKRGYNNTFDCSIHGTIYMTYGEFYKAVSYLKRAIKDQFVKDILKQDLQRGIETKDGQIMNIRITATDLLAKHFELLNYKQGNYQLYISNAV